MSDRIYRYEVPVDDRVHHFSLSGDPLAVGQRKRGVVEFWAVHHDTDDPDERHFTVVSTGQPLPPSFLCHWGHAYDMDGALVWHLIEVP